MEKGKNDSVFALMEAAAVEAAKGKRSQKNTAFAKKLSIDVDQDHLDIIDKRQKMANVHCGQRGIIWEALELLAEKYGL